MPGYVALFVALLQSDQTAEFVANTGPPEVAALLGSPIGRWVLPVAALATAAAGGLAARRRPHDETHLHHLALAFAPYLSLFGLLWFPYLVFVLPVLASSLHRALLLPHPVLRGVLVAALALSWLLMQFVGEPNDAIPLAAHLLGLLILLAVALAVLAHPGRIRITESVKTRATA